MVLLSRPEKEKLVLEMYSQGKTYKQIAQEVRISPRDIGKILNKSAVGSEKEKNGRNDNLPSAKAYELFRNGESPVEVAIALNLRQSETERFYKEFLKLNGWNKLARIHEALKDDIEHFVKLFRLCQIEEISPKDVIKLLEIANNKNGRGLKRIENRYESLKEEINSLEVIRLDLNKDLRNLQNQIKALTRVVNSLQLNSNEEQRQVIWLLEEKKALENLVEEFKNNDKEYEKIKQIAEQKAKDLLSDKRLILKLALLCVIKSMRNNKDKYNYLINGGILTSMPGTGYSNNNNNNQLFLVKQQHLSVSESNDEVGEICKSLLLDGAENFYQQLVTQLTTRTMVEAAFSI
jgi:hypothetical protein